MKKLLLTLLKKKVAYKFAIKEVRSYSGSTTLLPVVKAPGFFQGWEPIVKIYDTYYIAPGFDINKVFTREECNEHIEGYIKQLTADNANRVESTIYEQVTNYSRYGVIQESVAD